MAQDTTNDATIRPDSQVQLTGGKFADTSAAQLRQLFEGAKDDLLVYFHGGLVSKSAGTIAANSLRQAWADDNRTSIFVVWHSGLGEILHEHLGEIAADLLFVRLKRQLARFLKAKLDDAAAGTQRSQGLLALPDVRDAAERLPLASTDRVEPLTPDEELQINAVLGEDDKLADAVASLLAEAVPQAGGRALGAVAGPPSLVSESVRDALRREVATPGRRGDPGILVIGRMAINVLSAVLQRMRSGRDHGPYVTLVEEILRTFFIDHAVGSVWTAMKKDSCDAFGDDTACGGSALVDAIASWWKPGRRVRLVGHSTGAVYILELLDAFERRHGAAPIELTFDVCFLGGAATFARLDQSWDVWERRVRHFVSVGLDDERESTDQMVPVIYPRSLLYFVSGLAEDEVDAPLVGMQRYWTHREYAPACARAKRWLTIGRRLIWAGDGISESDASHHGDLDDDLATRRTVATFLEHA